MRRSHQPSHQPYGSCVNCVPSCQTLGNAPENIGSGREGGGMPVSSPEFVLAFVLENRIKVLWFLYKLYSVSCLHIKGLSVQ